MNREINIKFLIRIIHKKLKMITLISIVFAVVFGTYSYWKGGNNQETHLYSSYGKMHIKKNVDNIVNIDDLRKLIDDEDFEAEVVKEVNETISNIMGLHNYTEQNISLLTGDEVVSAVAKDADVKEFGFSMEDIRDMIYLRGKENGIVIEVNSVADDEEVADIVCDKVMEYGVLYFKENDYDAMITQDATKLGKISLELRESTADPRDTTAIIKPVVAGNSEMSLSSIIKDIILGFIVCFFIGCIYLCARYIIRDRIVYSDQIEELAGLRLLGTDENDDFYWHVYSNLFIAKRKIQAVNFISLKSFGGCLGFADRFAKELSGAGKKVLVVEYVGNAINQNDFDVEDKSGYKYTKIGNELLLKEESLKEQLDLVKQQYDFCIFVGGNISEKPMSKLLSIYADETVVLVEADTVKISEIYNVKAMFDEASVIFSDVIFMKHGIK